MPRDSTKGRRPVATWRRPSACLEKAATSAEGGADMMKKDEQVEDEQVEEEKLFQLAL